MSKIPIKSNGNIKWVDCTWAEISLPQIADRLNNWGLLALGDGSEPRHAEQVASGEIASIAAANWRTACQSPTRPVQSIEELKEAITKDPDVDAQGMLVVTADWFPGDYMGVCLFERTWANNIFMACLAAHPYSMRAQEGFSGVGVGLVYKICNVAAEIGAQNLWAQTTKISAPTYAQYFDLQTTTDHFIVSSETMKNFSSGYLKKWGVDQG